MNMYNALVNMVIARFIISVAKLRLFFESSIGCLWKIRNRNKNENSCKSANYETAGSAPYGKITSPPAFSVHKSSKRSSLCVIWAFVLYLLNPKTVKSLHGNDIILHTLTLAFNTRLFSAIGTTHCGKQTSILCLIRQRFKVGLHPTFSFTSPPPSSRSVYTFPLWAFVSGGGLGGRRYDCF